MKIALCGRFHSNKRYQGGSAEVFLSLAKELAKKNDLTLFGRGKPSEDIKKALNTLHVKYYWIPADSNIDILISPIRAYILFLKHLRNEEIINTHVGCFALASVFFKKNRKTVINIHEVISVKNRPFLETVYGYRENFMLFIGAKLADLTVVNTTLIKKIIQSKGIENVVVIPNGVDRNFFIDRQLKPNKKINLLFVGRLAVSKSIPLLIKTALILGDKVTLNIVGEGEMKNKLAKIIERNKQNNVVLHGIKKGKELLKFYRSANIFIMASEYEGFPLVLLEAMAAGVPIVASRVQGITDLVKDRGILVEPPTAEKFAFEISNLIKNRSLRNQIITKAKGYAKQFDWGKIADNYEREYKKTLDPNIKNKQTVVTISWDDGRKRDFKLATLLKKYNLKCTFYISPKNREWKKSDLMSANDIKALNKNFEIGAHSMTHPVLTRLRKDKIYKEIYDSKKYLENIIKEEVKSFCYPRGIYNEKIKRIVKKSGFTAARTTARFCINSPRDPFAFGTTIHTYNQKSDIIKILRFSKFNPKEFYRNLDWEYLAKRLFDYILINGGTFHLWGHSWEMDKFDEWDKLERVLSYVSKRKNIKYLANSELMTN